jgi:hypothetical protein
VVGAVEAFAICTTPTLLPYCLAFVRSEMFACVARLSATAAVLQGNIADDDKNRFLGFAFDFINNIGSHFLDYDLSVEHRVRCKQILFPAGFYLNTENKVYTPIISPIYGLATTKKDSPETEKSFMVLQVGKSFQQIRDEIARWRDKLAVPYQEHLLSR